MPSTGLRRGARGVAGYWLWAPAAVIVVVQLALLLPARDWSYLDWPRLSGLPLASMGLIGPVVVFCAASVGAAAASPLSPLAWPIASRSGWPTVCSHLGRMLTVWLAALVGSVAVCFVWLAPLALDDHLDLWPVAQAPVALVVLAAFGYACGRLVPARLTAAMVALATFLAGLMFSALEYPLDGPGNGISALWLSHPARASVGSRADATTAIWVLVAWTILAASAVVAAVLASTARAVLSVRPPRAALWTVVPLLAIVTTFAVVRPPVLAATTNPEVCTTVQHVRVCLPAQQRPVLDEVSGEVERFVTRVGPLAGAITTVATVGEMAPASGSVPVWVDPQNDVRPGVLSQLISYVSGMAACGNDASGWDWSSSVASWAAADTIWASGYPPEQTAYGQLLAETGRADLYNWLEQATPQIVACTYEGPGPHA